VRTVLVISLIAVLAVGTYLMFWHIPLCVHVTAERIQLPSRLGVCPPFVDMSLDDLRAEFEGRVKVGDEPSVVETALSELGVSFSWDRFQRRYQGIIRHPSSSWHTVVVIVHLDEQRRFKMLEVHDSFTTV